jgi:hypothetical protein
MPIPMPAGPGPPPDERPECKGCGWRFTPNIATLSGFRPDEPPTSRAYCGLCHGLNNDVARWVQAHPPTRRSIARPAWLELGRGVLWILLAAVLFTAFVGLVSFLDWLVFDWLRLL